MIRPWVFPWFAQAAPAGAAVERARSADAWSETAGERLFEFARFRQFDDERLLVALLMGVGVVILIYVAYVYRRDSIELKPGVGPLLLLLRLAAFIGLLIFFLKPEVRTDHHIVRHSRVVLLADVSQSMGLSDVDTNGETTSFSRSDQIIAALADGPLLEALRAKNDVMVSRFDERVEPIATLPKRENRDDALLDATETNTDSTKAGATPEGNRAGPTNWSEELVPRGGETRIGEALRYVARMANETPTAAIILLSDGAQNAGALPESAIGIAVDAEIPIYTVGVGRPEVRRNARISDFAAPARVYPGDAMTITVYLQASGFEGRFVDVTLRRRDAIEPDAPWVTVASERTALGPDGEMVAVPFEIADEVVGRKTYEAQIAPLDGDTNPADDTRMADVEIVDRQLRVLLMASGATREYRFLRNQLRRDNGFQTDVLLQSSPPGISQDASEILDRFPDSKDTLYEYDCIVAFDVDWLALDAHDIAILESWVSEKAGGLILIAGPIHSAMWLDSAEHSKLRDLFPVVFRRGLSLLGDGRLGSQIPWPLRFSREGSQADFLRLDGAPGRSGWNWDEFAGVYGYMGAKGPKPGATVYATFSDPDANLGAGEPVYMVGQFFGAGRVFFLGSGEMWRLRALGEGLFEVFYTNLLRHVTQGRLLRGTGRGVLLLERDQYLLGDTVVIQARLNDERHEPLSARSIELHVTSPDGATHTERLRAVPNRDGSFIGQFRVFQEGTYGLAIADRTVGSQVISTRIQVRLPDLERQHSELNQGLLSQIAGRTGGLYYGSLDLAIRGDLNLQPLAETIASREEIETVRGAPDPNFERRLMTWLLCAVCGALSVEWLIRRVSRLA